MAEKSIKDRDTAIKVIKTLVNKGDSGIIRMTFDSVPQKWQKKIVIGLEKADGKEFLEIFK